MNKRRAVQYTVRGVEPEVDRALRDRSRKEGCSLNEIALRAFRSFAGQPVDKAHQDLDDLIGTWVEDPAFDAAIEEQSRVDEDLWR